MNGIIQIFLKLLECWFELLILLWPVSACLALALACGLAMSSHQYKARLLKLRRHLLAPFFMPLKVLVSVAFLFGGIIPALLLPDIRLELLLSVVLFHVLWSIVLVIRHRGARSVILVVGASQLWLSLSVVGAVGVWLA